ncbi:MAG: metalloregulator ArsR/SmtB family transcription factor [Nitrospirota bacterium]|nr:metalloregulator ArsR/SmtB family transcription factor [Nitrospirota bacterium]
MRANCMADVSDEKLDRGARCIKTLAHPLRLKVLAVLAGREMSVGEILDAIGTTQSNVSQHLSQLRDKGVLASRREGNQVFYRVRDPKLFDLLALVRELFCDRPVDGWAA